MCFVVCLHRAGIASRQSAQLESQAAQLAAHAVQLSVLQSIVGDLTAALRAHDGLRDEVNAIARDARMATASRAPAAADAVALTQRVIALSEGAEGE